MQLRNETQIHLFLHHASLRRVAILKARAAIFKMQEKKREHMKGSEVAGAITRYRLKSVAERLGG